MDKKNTMLLTVIAVATLLVAVVGATFAYFSIVQSSGGSTTASFEGKVADNKNIGVASIKRTEKSIAMYLTAADMGQALKGTKYYATGTANSGDKTSNRYTTEEAGADLVNAYHEISTATITGGEADTVYHCTSKVTITATGGMKTYVSTQDESHPEDGKKIVADDGALDFKITGNSTTDYMYFDGSKGTVTKNYDLLTLLTGESNTFNVDYYFTGNTKDLVLQAALSITNRDADQNYLANQDVTLTITNDDFVCSVIDSLPE